MTDTYTITYSARGTTYTLNGYDADHGLTLNYLGDQGFGLAPLRRITTRGPLQNGDSDIDFRLDPRILQIPLMIKNESSSPKFNSYDIRERLLSIFRPQDAGLLNVSTSNGTLTKFRSLNVRVLGGMSFDVDPVDYHVRTVVQLRAEYPVWFDDGSYSLSWNSAAMGTTKIAANVGNFFSFPYDFFVTGPITNFTIANQTTNQSINVPGTISGGTTYYFDLRYGYKTVYTGPNQTGTNVISAVSASSNLTTWSIAAGNNTILVSGSGTGVGTNVSLQWQNQYTGI